jgi:hypothetical protein
MAIPDFKAVIELEKHGWTLECESPLELRHENGSFVSGLAALNLIANYKEVCKDHE